MGPTQRARLRQKGIMVTWTVPGESNLNSGGERPIYGVEKMVRGYLYDSGLPVEFMCFLGHHAVTVRKMIPRLRQSSNTRFTPTHLIFGERPYVGHLARIGCSHP